MKFLTTNLCTESSTTVSVSSVDPNFPAANLKHEFRSKRWRSSGVDDQYARFDFQTIEPVDAVILLWPKEDDIKLSDSAVIRVQANATDIWTSPAVNEVLTIDQTYEVATKFFSTDQNYRYWRVFIDDPSNPYGYVELGVVWIGKSLSIDNAENGFGFGFVNNSVVSKNSFGHSYVDQYPLLQQVQFKFNNMYYDNIQILENAYRINGNHKPVVIVLDPEEAVFTKDHFLVYGKFQNAIDLTHVSYNIFNTGSLNVLELA